METILKHLKSDRRGVSNAIVIMLSLVLIVIIVSNVILWGYQMNQLDWERAQEKIEIVDASGSHLTFSNEGSMTVHIVSLWLINSTSHQHYDLDFFVGSGEKATYLLTDTSIPAQDFIVKIVTERGNVRILSKH